MLKVQNLVRLKFSFNLSLQDYVRFGLEHWGSDKQGVANTRRFLLEWLSFLCRYVPVGIIEGSQRQTMNKRPPPYVARDDLGTLLVVINRKLTVI